MYDIQNSLHILRAAIKDKINYIEDYEKNVFDDMTYLEKYNISYLGERNNGDSSQYGNLFLLTEIKILVNLTIDYYVAREKQSCSFSNYSPKKILNKKSKKEAIKTPIVVALFQE